MEGWFLDFLPDLNQTDAEVERYLIQNQLWWIGITGLDGIRMDTWQYVPNTFWTNWTAAIKREYPKFTVVGEVKDGDVVHTLTSRVVQCVTVLTQVSTRFGLPALLPDSSRVRRRQKPR